MVAVPRLNPVIGKELRSRMRGWRAVATMSAYLVAVGGFGLLSLYISSQQTWLGGNAAFLGRSLLANIAMVELSLICFITPAFTAGVIAGERERQTHDLILTTPLSPRSIVLGKLFSALAYVLLLIIAALPIQGAVFLMGGVSPEELALTFALLIVTALGIGSLGLLFSSMVRTTLAATVLSYIAVLAVFVGTGMGYYLAGSITRSVPPEWIVYPNPLTALGSVLWSSGGPSIPMPLPAPVPVVRAAISAVPQGAVMEGGVKMAMAVAPQPAPVWQYYIAIYLTTSILAMATSTLLIKPTHPWLSRLRLRR